MAQFGSRCRIALIILPGLPTTRSSPAVEEPAPSEAEGTSAKLALHCDGQVLFETEFCVLPFN